LWSDGGFCTGSHSTRQGTRLGLSLSYDSLKTRGGEIKVETKEGEGSEFAIQLPVTSIIP